MGVRLEPGCGAEPPGGMARWVRNGGGQGLGAAADPAAGAARTQVPGPGVRGRTDSGAAWPVVKPKSPRSAGDGSEGGGGSRGRVGLSARRLAALCQRGPRGRRSSAEHAGLGMFAVRGALWGVLSGGAFAARDRAVGLWGAGNGRVTLGCLPDSQWPYGPWAVPESPALEGLDTIRQGSIYLFTGPYEDVSRETYRDISPVSAILIAEAPEESSLGGVFPRRLP